MLSKPVYNSQNLDAAQKAKYVNVNVWYQTGHKRKDISFIYGQQRSRSILNWHIYCNLL